MFWVGLLFGLGFDTAAVIALLVLAGSGAAALIRAMWIKAVDRLTVV